MNSLKQFDNLIRHECRAVGEVLCCGSEKCGRVSRNQTEGTWVSLARVCPRLPFLHGENQLGTGEVQLRGNVTQGTVLESVPQKASLLHHRYPKIIYYSVRITSRLSTKWCCKDTDQQGMGQLLIEDNNFLKIFLTCYLVCSVCQKFNGFANTRLYKSTLFESKGSFILVVEILFVWYPCFPLSLPTCWLFQ